MLRILKLHLILFLILFCKNAFTQNLPIDTTFFDGSIAWDIKTSKESVLYQGVENVITMKLLDVNPGNIYLIPLIDTSEVTIITTFYADDGGAWVFELVEEARGKIPDEGVAKFKINPKNTGVLPFDIFVKDSISTIHFARFSLDVLKLNKPILNLSKFNNLKVKKEEIIKELENVRVINLSNYTKKSELYGVNHITITVFNKRNNIRYKGEAYGNYITTHMKNGILKSKKGDKIIINQLVSDNFEYEKITVWLSR